MFHEKEGNVAIMLSEVKQRKTACYNLYVETKKCQIHKNKELNGSYQGLCRGGHRKMLVRVYTLPVIRINSCDLMYAMMILVNNAIFYSYC